MNCHLSFSASVCARTDGAACKVLRSRSRRRVSTGWPGWGNVKPRPRQTLCSQRTADGGGGGGAFPHSTGVGKLGGKAKGAPALLFNMRMFGWAMQLAGPSLMTDTKSVEKKRWRLTVEVGGSVLNFSSYFGFFFYFLSSRADPTHSIYVFRRTNHSMWFFLVDQFQRVIVYMRLNLLFSLQRPYLDSAPAAVVQPSLWKKKTQETLLTRCIEHNTSFVNQ